MFELFIIKVEISTGGTLYVSNRGQTTNNINEAGAFQMAIAQKITTEQVRGYLK